MPEFSSHLTGSDAVLWNIERDPALRTTIVGIALLDGTPGWRRLRARIERASLDIARMRQRVVAAPFYIGTPHWQTAPGFDLDYHLRRVVCPSPGSLRDVLDLAGPIAMAAFDKERPLWEFTLVEGLDGGRAALIQKLHHSVTDGVGAVQLARRVLDDSRAPRSRRRPTSPAATPAPASETPRFHLPGIPNLSPANLSPARLVRGATSVAKLVAPTPTPLSSLMVGRGAGRRLDTIDLPLHDLAGAAHDAGCTLNDAFLASVIEGLRRYHERHGVAVGALRVNMPVNLRHANDPPGANRFVPVRMVVPVEAVDAPERMRRLGAVARAWRAEPALPATSAISGLLTRLHPIVSTAILSGMLKGVDLVATNVPGFTTPVYLAGTEVERLFAFGPTSGAAVNVALVSHLDRCCVGVNVDTEAVPDAAVLVACLQAGFIDVVGSRRGAVRTA